MNFIAPLVLFVPSLVCFSITLVMQDNPERHLFWVRVTVVSAFLAALPYAYWVTRA
jgi:hypothetical protein